MAKRVPNYDGTCPEGDHYECIGSVRGWCGHKHTSLDAAVRCQRSDRAGCARQGGYSDRQIFVMDKQGRKIEAVDYV